MALQSLSARELAGTPTLFASFMGHVGTRYQTVGELLAIYRERSARLRPTEDAADDLRIERFVADMAADSWTCDVVIVLVIDGIHRAIAYLACVEQGISPARLPALHVDC
jgi:hypothetical protein